MKKYLFLLIIALFAMAASAQDAMLTKEETVNYLHKKLQEIDGRDMVKWWEPGLMRLSAVSLRMKGDELELKYTRTFPDGLKHYYTYLFNPGHISKFDEPNKIKGESAVRDFIIVFPTKSGRWSCCDPNSKFEDAGSAHFPYFAALPGNRQKMEKALLHLRDLARAEDDPFGN